MINDYQYFAPEAMDLHVKSVGYDENQHYFHHLQLPQVEPIQGGQVELDLGQQQITGAANIAFIKPYGQYCHGMFSSPCLYERCNIKIYSKGGLAYLVNYEQNRLNL